jgi:hypothetical protein
MWVANMIFCVAIAFGSFAWAVRKMMTAENEKRKAT